MFNPPELSDPTSQTMRLSSAMALAVVVVAALASSTSATPTDASAKDCPIFCWIDNNCNDHMHIWQLFPFCSASRVSTGGFRSSGDIDIGYDV
ncbi:hypothetical protein BDR05DRAFT_967024 [Suillus weaverae]|nr:hypothetical protein BDR05DRAFT_967024 [Suillus weaverae]